MKVRDDATQWQIHLHRSAWPQRAGLHFIVAAFDKVLSTLWKLGTEDLVGEDFEDGTGYRNAAAGHFHTALMTGALAAKAQPSKGGATRPIPSTDWVPDVVDRALATGRITRKLNGRRDDMWVFIDDAELQIMCGVLAITDMLHRPEDSGPLEAMGEMVLGNMSAIAESRRPRDDQAAANRLLRLLLRLTPKRLDEIDMASVTTAVATLLREKFDADPKGLLSRDDFEIPIYALYAPHLSTRMFDNAWREATLWQDKQGERPYESRRGPGRKRAA